MPPRDPYVPVPTAQPRQVRGEVATTPINIRFDPVHISGAVGDALGRLGQEGYGTLSRATAHVGAAFDSLGKSLDRAGDQLWDRAVGLQQIENETKASNAIVEYEHYVEEKRSALQLQQGANATSTNLKMFNDDLEAKRQELRSKLPAAVQRRFDPTSISFAGRAGVVAANHIATQTRAAAVGAASAEVDMAVKQMGDAPDQQSFMDGYNRAHAKYHDVIGPTLGLTRQEIDVRVAEKAQAGLLANVTKMSETDPSTAWKMFYANKDKIINPAVEEKARNTIQMNEVNWAVRGATDRATTDLWDDKAPGAPTKTEAERIKEAKYEANLVLSEDVKNNPTMMSALNETIEKRVESAVSRQERAARNYRVHTLDALTAQIYGPDGEIRDSIEKIWASGPEAKAMYDSLPPTGDHSQKSVRDAIDTAVRKDERIDPFVSGQNREYIRGLADSDDINQREKLMDMNLWDKNLKDDQGRSLKLNHGDRQALIALRNKLKKDPRGDPRVPRAWKWLLDARGQEMDALGLTSIRKDDPDYIGARGALGEALDAYEETHKGLPADYKAVKEEIAPQLLKHFAGSWFPWKAAEFPAWSSKTDVPEKWKDEYDRRLKADGKALPENHDDPEYRRAYVHKMFLDSMTKPKPTDQPPGRSVSARHTAYSKPGPRSTPATMQPTPVPLSE